LFILSNQCNYLFPASNILFLSKAVPTTRFRELFGRNARIIPELYVRSQMKSVIIKSTSGSRSLVFSKREGEYFSVTLAGDLLSATKGVWGYTDTECLPDLFESIATDWKGWKGEKKWRAIEGDFQMIATCDNLGHIKLEIEIRNEPPDDWIVRAPLFLEAGSVDTIAKELREYFKPITKTEQNAPRKD
jgi:hypothetical protein